MYDDQIIQSAYAMLRGGNSLFRVRENNAQKPPYGS
jgi:hypothetical protein